MITLQQKVNCCGCNACTQSCHSECICMLQDNEGFLYPKVDLERCVDCGLCEKVCPVINQAEARKPVLAYAAKNKDEDIRKQSSSGGIFTLLSEKIIENGGVVFGARFDDKWESLHDYTETVEGLAAFRGSKYVQSRTGNTFQKTKEFLKEGRKVLFSGTPCQIAGLKLFLCKEYDNLITIDFVCHGVPSPKVWRTYLDYMIDNQAYNGGGKNCIHQDTETITKINFRDKTYGWKKFSVTIQMATKSKIESIHFRDKRKGWKKYNFILCFCPSSSTENQSFIEPLDKNIFMKGFLKDLYLRPSCYDCPSKKFKSGSDITLGDYWGIQNVLPDFDDDKGVSLVMINTDKGKQMYEQLNAESIRTTYTDALKGNSSIEKSVNIPQKREYFFAKLNKENILDIINELTYISVTVRIKRAIILVVSTVLRKTGVLSVIKTLIIKK